MKILVAADGSSHTKRMLVYLAAHAEWLGPAHQYTVIDCTPTLPPRAKAYFDRETLRSYSESEFEKVFKPMRKFFKRHATDVTFVGKTSPTTEVIGALADTGKFDLPVMGSVVTKAMASCATPMLIVR